MFLLLLLELSIITSRACDIFSCVYDRTFALVCANYIQFLGGHPCFENTRTFSFIISGTQKKHSQTRLCEAIWLKWIDREPLRLYT